MLLNPSLSLTFMPLPRTTWLDKHMYNGRDCTLNGMSPLGLGPSSKFEPSQESVGIPQMSHRFIRPFVIWLSLPYGSFRSQLWRI